MSERHIALIGGAGFIGHHLALELTRRGDSVTVIDSLRVNNIFAFSKPENESPAQRNYMRILQERQQLLQAAGVRVITQDSRDKEGLKELLAMLQPSVIVHLAAIAHADRCNRDFDAAFGHTLLTLHNTLASAPDTLKHIIFFSSSMVYGNFSDEYVTETSPCEPLGVYGALKFSGEKIVQAFNQVTGVDYTIIRPSALYGPRCVSRRVTQVFIETALKGEPLIVTGDGCDRLDFTHINDLTDGVIRAIDSPASRGEVFNITYGKSHSIQDLLNVVDRHIPGVAVEYKQRDRLTPTRGTLCVDKARALIGYEPQWDIERGVAQYFNWYRAFLAQSVSIETKPHSVAAIS